MMMESTLENPIESSQSKNAEDGLDAQFVLEFLRKRGLDKAALELQNHVELKKSKSEASQADSLQPNSTNNTGDEQDEAKALEIFEQRLKIAQTPLQRSTGGGLGYDLDSGGSILPWAVLTRSAEDSGDLTLENSNTGTKVAASEKEKKMRMEIMAYVKSFEAFQSWVLSLPDDQYVIDQPGESLESKQDSGSSKADPSDAPLNRSQTTAASFKVVPHYHTRIIPASCKFELLSVCFPLFVYVYCDLLACGFEQKAASFLQTYCPIYEPTYPTEMRDLQRCNSTQIYNDMNRDVKYVTDVFNELKIVRSTLHSLKQKKKELESTSSENPENPRSIYVSQVDEEIQRRESALVDLSRNATTLKKKLLSFPFLQTVGLKRSNISVSQLSYFLLSGVLNKEALLPMCAMLQSRCYLSVQRRDPLPYIPPCVFEKSVFDHEDKEDANEIAWAAPIHPILRAAEAGEDISNVTTIINHAEELPFPKLFLEKEYDSNSLYEKDKRTVEFNRSLLVHGFRRLEALEIKHEYENGTRKAKNVNEMDDGRHETKECCNALSPSILLATLCTVTSHPKQNTASRSLTIEVPSMGITCAKMCPPDGRRVATGCEDSAIRIWSMESLTSKHRHVSDNEDFVPTGEASTILLGHKNGFPVYDVDWNRDGRTLLSAGGDGSLRLWDTMAVGPFGRLANIRRVTHGVKSSNLSSKSSQDPSLLHVPGEKSESLVEVHGAALACYRGHSLSTPVWSAAFAPCGYYFASAGSDATARLWCTDRPAPIRIFSGHFSPSVNNVTWHPNCNYLLSCGDDKTVRMWDIQTGRCVRILTGSSSGIGIVRVCPSGRYAAAADYSGIVHVWELGSGKRINELRHVSESDSSSCGIHSLCYSACGMAIATGSNDCTVRIWDAKGMDVSTVKQGNASYILPHDSGCEKFGERVPVKIFKTRQTSILDLNYSKRNLLFAVGRYV